jgi:hypothetical protein
VRPISGPIVRPITSPLGGGGLPWEESGGGAAPYNPLTDADLDLRVSWPFFGSALTISDTDKIDTVTDEVGGLELTGTTTTRFTYSATAITDQDGGTHAGAVVGGAHIMQCTTLNTLMQSVETLASGAATRASSRG